jgi:hypothetical protein
MAEAQVNFMAFQVEKQRSLAKSLHVTITTTDMSDVFMGGRGREIRRDFPCDYCDVKLRAICVVVSRTIVTA